MNRLVFHLLLVLATILLFAYCGSVEYKDPSQAKGTRQWGPKEVKDTVAEMTSSLSGYYFQNLEGDYLDWQKFENNTSEHIDTRLLGNEISTNLIQKKIPFVDTSMRARSLDEMSFASSGLTSEKTKPAMGKLISPSHRLTGELNDLVNYDSGDKIQYIVVTLRLVNLETNAVVWQDEKKFLKVSTVEGYGF